MSYLRPGTMVNNRKWNLGMMGRGSAARRAPGRRLYGLAGLGISDAELIAAGIDPSTGLPYLPGTDLPQATWTPMTAAPALPLTGAQAAAWSNVLTSTTPPTDPLSYVSPQAAIAAGLNPATVNAAWTARINQFPSVQAGVAAGIPAGVMTTLWTGGTGARPAAPASFLDQAPLGIANKYLLGLGAGVFVLAMMGGN